MSTCITNPSSTLVMASSSSSSSTAIVSRSPPRSRRRSNQYSYSNGRSFHHRISIREVLLSLQQVQVRLSLLLLLLLLPIQGCSGFVIQHHRHPLNHHYRSSRRLGLHPNHATRQRTNTASSSSASSTSEQQSEQSTDSSTSSLKLHTSKQQQQHVSSSEYNFFDTAKIFVAAGSGGNGCVSFRREKGEARGGPNGGSGGMGGHVYLEAAIGLQTLLPCKQRVHVRAKSGANGQGKHKHGANAEDTTIRVPVGTLVRDAATGKLAGELRYDGQTLMVAKGGRGGRGNASFKTNRRTAPKLAERGEFGASRWLELELRLVAQVGFLGMPNAGKSTLLAAASAAKPKIANYPFTTIVPNLGVCDLIAGEEGQGLVLCDIPGLIPGAARGAGMGSLFLRHVQRCRVLLHIVDGTSPDPVSDYKAIQAELKAYDETLSLKPQVVVLNKMDIPQVQEKEAEILRALTLAAGHSRVLSISAATMLRVSELFARLHKFVQAQEEQEQAAAAIAQKQIATTTTTTIAESSYVFDEEDFEDYVVDEGEKEEDSKYYDLVPPASMDSAVASTTAAGAAAAAAVPEIDLSRTGLDYPAQEFEIQSDPSYPNQWRIVGNHIESVARMTHWEYPQAVERFGRQLQALGMADALVQKGAQQGDLIMIDKYDFEFISNSKAGWSNPYIPPELMEEEQQRERKKNQKTMKSTTLSSRNNKNDDDLPWRPFRDGGYLDVDVDELVGFNDDEGSWDLFDGDGDDDGDEDDQQNEFEGKWDEDDDFAGFSDSNDEEEDR